MKLKLKNYRVINKIGQGGMGVVYVAEDLALGRLVALKVLAPYLVQDPEIIKRFRSEARNQARLIHPNITMVYSFLQENEQAFLVLEFIDGETLESKIIREGRIPAVESVAIFRKILGAIEYAHSKGVIHRDIKPSNIAFTSEAQVKIMDFGIALNVEEDGRLTRTGHVLGTPHYMAPEQILGQEVTFATDIYALGITLFEMVTGRLPFDSKSDFEVRLAQVKHPPPPPRSFGHPDITPELEEVILTALAKAPDERFSSAGEFLQDLEAAVEQDHLHTVVKKQLDRPTHLVGVPRRPAPPTPEPESDEPPAPLPEPLIAESAPALEPQAEEPQVPPPEEGPPEGLSAPLSSGPQGEEDLSPHLAEAQEFSGTPPLEPQMEVPPGAPAFTPQFEASPALPPSEGLEIAAPPPFTSIEELPIPALSEAQVEEPSTPTPGAQIDKGVVLPLLEPEPEESLAGDHAEAAEIAGPPSLEAEAGLSAPPLPEPLIEAPAPEAQMEEPAVASAPALETAEPQISPPAAGPQEELSPPLSLGPEVEEPPGPQPSQEPEFFVSQEDDLPVSPPPEPRWEESPPSPSESRIEEISAPVAIEPPPPEPPAEERAEAMGISGSPAPEQIAELAVSPAELAREGPFAPPPEPPGEEPLVQQALQEEAQEPAAPAPAPPPPEILDVFPPAESQIEAAAPWPLPLREKARKLAALPVSEEPFVPAEVRGARFSKPRIIFVSLTLLALLASGIFLRGYVMPGPAPKATVLPQAQVAAVQKAAPPSPPREEKVQAAESAAVPPASPVAKEPPPAEPAKLVQDQAEKEKPVTLAALNPPEKKPEIPEAKEPKPVDWRKAVKERLAANGFPNLGVTVDDQKGVVISGNVRTALQKDKVIKTVNSLGLSVPADYSGLKVVKEAVAEVTKKKVPEERPARPQVSEPAPKPAPPETPRKPLAPRLDRGNIQF